MTTSERDRLDLLQERVHYEVIRLLGNPFNAIKYLYDRLNIIDSKTSALLRLNALCFTIISVIVGAWLRPTGKSPDPTDWGEELLFLGIATSLLVSTVNCFRMFTLKFDHVTAFDDAIVQTEIQRGCQCASESLPSCTKTPMCNARRIAIVEQDAVQIPSRRTLKQYEDTFFEITITRQKYLKLAIRYSATAGVLFAALLLYMSVPRLTNIRILFDTAVHYLFRP